MVEVAWNDWEFMDWGTGNKSQSGMCEQGRNCFRDILGWGVRVKVMLALVGLEVDLSLRNFGDGIVSWNLYAAEARRLTLLSLMPRLGYPRIPRSGA